MRTPHILKMLYAGCSMKKQYNCFFHERPKFQEKMTFEKAFWIKCGKTKHKK